MARRQLYEGNMLMRGMMQNQKPVEYNTSLQSQSNRSKSAKPVEQIAGRPHGPPSSPPVTSVPSGRAEHRGQGWQLEQWRSSGVRRVLVGSSGERAPIAMNGTTADFWIGDFVAHPGNLVEISDQFHLPRHCFPLGFQANLFLQIGKWMSSSSILSTTC
nr:hypothetical protein Itr_chr01CG06420 [Ipomoea trifida]